MVDGTCRDVSKPNVTPDWRNWIRSTVAYHDKFCITPGVIEPGLVNHGRKGEGGIEEGREAWMEGESDGDGEGYEEEELE